MDLIKNYMSPFNQNALRETAKLVIIGGTVETARRAAASGWNSFVDSFFLTAHFSQEDYPYDWIMHWLSKQPAWSRAREFEITTRSVSNKTGLQMISNDDDFDDVEEDDDELVHGRKKRKVAFLPSNDTTHSIFYHGHWLRITRSKRSDHYGTCSSLKISVVARNNGILKKLVMQAKKEYDTDMEHRVHIFLADVYGGWRWNGARHKRPLSSIVLEPGVKDMLIADAKDFLRSEDWYAERGIPFRRGYLLHGVPGSGKTSLIHAIAGELGLDIYVVSLSGKGMNDTTLTNLMGRVPSRCILLLEDLDAAFTRSVCRDATSTGAPTSATTAATAAAEQADGGNTLSLSGLLNSLDGVAAAEGRLLFATTNHIERLDPALSRPGRMDVWIDFKHASQWQAEGIFKNFFPCKKSADEEQAAKEKDEAEALANPTKAKKPKRPSTHTCPILEEEELNVLAAKFAAQIPEDELSVASLQGYLLKNKTRPREAVEEVGAWVLKERETKAKLKKEKEEKEALEKKEKDEKEAKEKLEKEATEAKEKKELAEKEEAEKKAKEELEAAERRRLRRKAKTGLSSTPAPAASTPQAPSEVAAQPPAPTPIPTPQPEVTPTSESSNETSETSTSSEGSNASDGDEESVSSETDNEKSADEEVDVSSSQQGLGKDAGNEKWIAVKGANVPVAAAAAVDVTVPASDDSFAVTATPAPVAEYSPEAPSA